MSVQKAVPTIALIGLPNSGKSSLINRICGRKTAIVANEPHTTRDLNYGYDFWEGMYIRFIDTGGLVPDPSDEIQSAVQIRSWSAIADADLLIWVIDRATDPESISDILVKRLWKSGKPFLIAVNKVDDPSKERECVEFAEFGVEEIHNISTITGYGIGDLLDRCVQKLKDLGYTEHNYIPAEGETTIKPSRKKGYRIQISQEGRVFDWEDRERVTKLEQDMKKHTRKEIKKKTKILVIGRPNVGKSTLINAILGEEKQIVSPIAGTTLSVNRYDREYRGRIYEVIDTTGIRKLSKRKFGAETFATYRTIEVAHEVDIILLVLDVTTGITAQDQLVAGIARETRAGVIIIANKSDALTPDSKARFLKDFALKLSFLKVSQFIYFSALLSWKGNNSYPISKIFDSIDKALVQIHTEIDQSEVRQLFNYLMKKKPPKKLRLKQKPILYDLVYCGANPHTFELWVKDKKTLHFSYIRFLENTIKSNFNLVDIPVRIKVLEKL